MSSTPSIMYVAQIDADAVENVVRPREQLTLRSAICFCIRIAQSTAGTTEGNSAVAHRLDEPAAESARTIGTAALAMLMAHRARRARFVLAHQPGVAHHVGGEDRGKAAGRRSFVRGPRPCAWLLTTRSIWA